MEMHMRQTKKSIYSKRAFLEPPKFQADSVCDVNIFNYKCNKRAHANGSLFPGELCILQSNQTKESIVFFGIHHF